MCIINRIKMRMMMSRMRMMFMMGMMMTMMMMMMMMMMMTTMMMMMRKESEPITQEIDEQRQFAMVDKCIIQQSAGRPLSNKNEIHCIHFISSCSQKEVQEMRIFKRT